MIKKSWAKGRRQEQYKIAISKESHKLLGELADEAKLTMKDFFDLLMQRYVQRKN